MKTRIKNLIFDLVLDVRNGAALLAKRWHVKFYLAKNNNLHVFSAANTFFVMNFTFKSIHSSS